MPFNYVSVAMEPGTERRVRFNAATMPLILNPDEAEEIAECLFAAASAARARTRDLEAAAEAG